MKSLLLVAHGSRRAVSNDEVRALSALLSERAGSQFDMVKPAFLELAEPSIPDGIQQCIDQGATAVTVLPYFLSAGRHVSVDIPAEVKVKQEQHPSIDIKIASYLGSSQGIVDLLLASASSS